MAIVYINSYTVYYTSNATKMQFASLAEAMTVAENYVGNRSYNKIPNEKMWLYGPGNGDTTVMIRQDIDIDAFMGRK